jgi:hypothetical protein
MVRHMLIRRSQLQPVTMAAAAGGKMMATCTRVTDLLEIFEWMYDGVNAAHENEADV